MEVCPVCKLNKPKLTRDHVCPQWLLKCAPFFGVTIVSPKPYIQAFGRGYNNIKMMCRECNQLKSGMLDIDDQFTRQVLASIKDNIEYILSEQYKIDNPKFESLNEAVEKY